MKIAALLAALFVFGCTPTDDDDSGPDDDGGLFDLDDDDAGGTPIEEPSAFDLDCDEVEPNDLDIPLGGLSTPSPPWEPATPCGMVPAASSRASLALRGRISDVVEGTWNGDNDAWTFTFAEAASPRGVLQWSPLQGDLDAQVHCEQTTGGLGRLFGGALASAEVPETAQAVFEVPAGGRCWAFVTGFDGRVADYVLWLEPAEL